MHLIVKAGINSEVKAHVAEPAYLRIRTQLEIDCDKMLPREAFRENKCISSKTASYLTSTFGCEELRL